MHHTPPLILTIVGGFVLAFIFGMLAHRAKMPPLIGYIVAGIFMGPFTPGLQGDIKLAQDLAEIGVILLMFGVGLHFSLKDLLSVRAIVVPGALIEIVIITSLGMALAKFFGWSAGAGLIFGLSLSVASTVLLLTALQERRTLETKSGRIAIGWLVVEDVTMVLALVLIPALSGMISGDGVSMSGMELAKTLGMTLGKVAAFVVVMLVVGRRVIPWVLERVANTGSHELFRLGVLAIALGFALGSAYLFGVSFALGAFFAGMILNESELSHRAAEESLPLRDAFSVLFFVSIGMLFDPTVLVREPLMVLATVLIIVVGKSVTAFSIMRAFGHPRHTALMMGASLAQIGEFSFILVAMGITTGLLSPLGRDMVLSGAIISILINPFLFTLVDRRKARHDKREADAIAAGEVPLAAVVGVEPIPALPEMEGHTVLVGFGRVGHFVAAALMEERRQFIVIEDRQEVVDALRADGIPAVCGNAVAAGMMEAVSITKARWLLVAIPNPLEAGKIIDHARELNPGIEVVARAHSVAEVAHLEKHGATHTIMGEREIADGMAKLVVGSENVGAVAAREDAEAHF
jgi:CPA2 family monovalent cation:H+ antiporter-2